MEKGDLLINDAEGWLKQAKEQFEAAIASCNQALKIKPDYHESWYYWGLALAKRVL
ncbi:MAG: tetratricopeptide repeat protein [Symploca sp. SIO2E6]|nr:tetratricopeptide repeat protein [Symploca sp. SIO2E6]